MPRIKLLVKPDNLFLTQTIYEGILVMLQHNRDAAKISLDEIALPGDALRKTLEQISIDEELAEHYRNADIGLVGNDIKHNIGGALLRSIGIKTEGKITNIKQIIIALLENTNNIQDLKDTILTYRIGKNFLIGSEDRNLLSGLQIFKVDRYTGLTSLDAGATYRQYTVKSEPLLLFLAILGLASSYAGGTREYSYHLFLSPDEIIEVLVKGDPEYLYNIMSVKREVIKRLKEILRSRVPEEVVILKTLIDLSLQDLLSKYEIDYLSLQLYVIAREGNTFKIYSKIPLTIYSRPYYLEVLRETVRDPEKLVEALEEALKPGSPLINAIQRLALKQKPVDSTHALTAIRELHRFISSGDLDGLYGFLRELETAKKVLEQEGDKRSIQQAKKYEYLLSRISSPL